MTPDFLKLDSLGDKLGSLARLGDKRLISGKLSAVSVVRVTDGVKAHISDGIPARKLYVTADGLAAKSMASRLKSFPGARVGYLPYRDDVLLARRIFSAEAAHGRVAALSALIRGEIDTLVVSADALPQKFPCKRLLESFTLTLCAGDVKDPTAAADALSAAGYARQELISDPGDFALRGDILDVYIPDGAAVRINFFDDIIENIKLIDPVSMLATGDSERVIIPPASDILLGEDDLKAALEGLRAYAGNPSADACASELRVGACPPSTVWAMPFAPAATSSLFDYFDEPGSLIILDEPKVISEKLGILSKEFEGRMEVLSAGGEVTPRHYESVLPLSEIRRRLLTARKLSFSGLGLGNPLFEPSFVVEPKCRPVTKYYLAPQSIYADLKNFSLNGFRTLVCCGDANRARSILANLAENDVYAEFSADGNGSASVLVAPLGIENGFIYPALKVAVIGQSECVGKHRGDASVSRKTQFIAPKAGDYVVHRVHGVGLCEGTAIIKSGDFEKEYIVLRYRDGDVLYVATDQMDNLQKFVGEQNPKLNKLGGKEFEREKEKVRKSVRKLAVNLMELYAKRERAKGFRYSPDTVWQQEFEDSFEYEETADQLKAIAAVKQDMESGRIMDRLLVGDVGFGKTEVAFRAMFKTVLDGKQAVLLAPTTILARQHHENLAARLEPFGIECGLLTRLQSGGENARVVRGLADGSLHMVVATHKVLSDNIIFHDPGLLVLDEEQRFGVEHKEKLKEKYPLINVLTLSATPIPRTLNMALGGIREISMLETPPKGRLPVQTYVAPYSDSLVADAVTRECSRGGQTLILLNNIAALDAYARRLASLLPPDVRIVTAHGQLSGGELEKRIAAFYDKKYDVLASTTIIENGIDLPDANTLVVVDARRFGLSQLYQLRGRVGRRGALAHAYFTIPDDGALTDVAEKRLRTLLDNTEIGSGFRVALSDLSIRGAGEILGAEQHGHIERVGYEMYVELLGQAVEEIRTGKPHREAAEVEMKVDAPAYIREGYVSGRDKLRIYKRIAQVADFDERDRLIAELGEVYGPADKPLLNLIDIALLKNLSRNFDVARVTINRSGAGVTFRDAEIFGNEALMTAVSRFAADAVLTNTIPPSLIFNVAKLAPENKIAKLLDFFKLAAGGAA